MAEKKRSKPRRVENGDGVLDLETKFERPRLRIDGVEYAMRHPGELKFAEFRRIDAGRRWLASFFNDDGTAAAGKPEVTDADVDERMTAIFALVAPDVPAAIVAKLPDFQKLRALEHFSKAAPKLESTAPPTTTPRSNSSPDSNAFTAAGRATGSA